MDKLYYSIGIIGIFIMIVANGTMIQLITGGALFLIYMLREVIEAQFEPSR